MKIKFQREKGERFIFEKLVSEKLTGTDRSIVNILGSGGDGQRWVQSTFKTQGSV